MSIAHRAQSAFWLALIAVAAAVSLVLAPACPAYAATRPTIVSPSEDATIACVCGEPLTLRVEATAAEGETLSYQWITQSNGNVDIEGATEDSYAVPTDSVGYEMYACRVTSTDANGKTKFKLSPLFAVTVIATSGTWGEDGQGGTWSYDREANTLTVSGEGAMPDYTKDDRPWAGIAAAMISAEEGGGPAASIVVGDGVTYIGSYAFSSMTATSASYGGVSGFGEGAFKGTPLESIQIPEGVEYVPDWCFYGNAASSVTVPDSVAKIGARALSQYSSLTLAEASIPSGCSFVYDELAETGIAYDSFPAACTVTRRVNVTFADAEGAELATAQGGYVVYPTADAATSCTIAYDGDAPAKDADGAGHYSFAGWVTRDAEGAETAVEANEDGTFTVSGDATFYASFTCEEHSYVDTVVEATTEAGGYTEHVCSECGYAYRDAETPKLDEATAAVVDAIKALPESVEGDEAIAAVKAAAEAYLALTDEERAAVADKYAAALVEAQEKALEAVEASASAAAVEAAKQLEALEQAKAQAEADAAAAQASALKASSLKVTAKAVKAKAKKKTKVKASKAFSVAGAAGKVTFAKVKGNAKITVSAKGKVTVRKGLKKGKTYKVKVLVADAGTSQVAGGSQVVTLKVKVK